MKIKMIVCLVVISLLALSSRTAAGQEIEVDPEPKGYASGIYGKVLVLEPESAEPKPLSDSDPVFEGSRLTAAENSYAEIHLLDGSEIKLDELTQLDLNQIKTLDEGEQPERMIDLSMIYGTLRVSTPVGFSERSMFKVTTPVAVTGVRGTDFAVEYESEEESKVDVFDGEVAVAQEGSEQTVGADESATAGRGRGISKSALQEHRKQRWESFREAMNLHGNEQAETRLREKIERVRAENPDDPRLAGLENAVENVSNRREEAKSRFEGARENMKDRRRERVDRMREFAKKHGRERFEQARRFRGGALSPEERQKAGEKLRERRQNVREKAKERHQERKERLKENQDQRKDRLEERRDNRKEQIQERKGHRQENRRGGTQERKQRTRDRRR